MINVLKYQMSLPTPHTFNVIETSEIEYFNAVASLTKFKSNLKYNGESNLILSPEMIMSYLTYEPGFSKLYPIKNFSFHEDGVKIILENKVKGGVYEIYLFLHPQAKNGKLYLKTLEAYIGKIKIPKSIAQKEVDRFTNDNINFPFNLKSIENNEKGIKLVGTKL